MRESARPDTLKPGAHRTRRPGAAGTMVLVATAVLLAVSAGGLWGAGIDDLAGHGRGHRPAAAGAGDQAAAAGAGHRVVTAPAAPAARPPASPSATVHSPTQLDVVVPTVGALFDGTGAHFCTASVVASPQGDLLITAAHCVYTAQAGYRTGVVFVPGYHDGVRPYGTWPVSAITVDPRWVASADPDADFAFLTVAPVAGREIADVVGANLLATDPEPGSTIELFGYPDVLDEPLACAAPVQTESATQIQIYCPDYSGGTSGGPWLSNFDPGSGTGQVVGVIGGYQQGGDTPDISYSSYFDAAVLALYSQVS